MIIFCGPTWKIWILIFMLILTIFFLYSMQSLRNKVYSSSNQENFLANSYSFSYSSTDVLVKDIYEAGHLIANADLCPDLGKNMKLMILVTSALDHSDARMAIRQTWSFYSRHHNVGVGFIVGSYIQPSHNSVIQKEHQTYNDLIQARLVDSYDNLTLKTVSMLEWVDTYCSQVPFVLKTDDDMFINIPQLLALLEQQQQAKRSIFGRLVHEGTPSRDVYSKYFLNKSEYEPDTFPDFLTGPAYLMTQDSVHDLYHRAFEMPFLKLEDVFVTGWAAASIGIRIINVNEFFNVKIPFNVTQIREAISIHDITPSEQFLLWAFVIFENKLTDKSLLDWKPVEYLCEFPYRNTVRTLYKKLHSPRREFNFSRTDGEG